MPRMTPTNAQKAGTPASARRKPAQNLAPKATKEDNERIAAQPTLQPETNTGLGGFVSLDETTDYVKSIFWGREGSSKTTSACHAANHGRVLVINAEAGLKVKALKRQGVNTANIQVWPNPSDPDTEITHSSLEAVYYQVKSDLIRDPSSWFAVVVDSVTEVADALVGHVSDHRVDKASARAESQGMELDEYDRWMTDRNDYGVMGKQFRDLLRKFRDLPCHLILTALERRDVDEDTGKVTYGPALSPGIQKDVLGYMDLVFYFKEAEPATKKDPGKPYRAVTHLAGVRRSKDRYGLLPQVLNEPTFTRVLSYLDEQLDETTDPVQGGQVPEDPEPDTEPVKSDKDETTKTEPTAATSTDTKE